ncbi:hypothetical protein EGI22_06410, partial [Lacihabitans sp. LS3-19]|uniref:PKD-like domain-containing protein n=1 Tax=Lacihabitans sp. LS3-19 TaxID=2487335 RepID=UPI0020CEF60F
MDITFVQILLKDIFAKLLSRRISFTIALVWAFFVCGNIEAKEFPVKSTTNTFVLSPPLNFPGEITGNEVNNGPYDPGVISSVSAATATSSSIRYQWQSSTDGINWTIEIGNTSNDSYDPGPITQTTYYKRLARNTTSTSTNTMEGESNIITKAVTNYTINTPVSVTQGNSINLNQTGVFPDFRMDLVVNGDFTSGNSGFTTDIPNNRYWVTDQSSDYFSGYSFRDYTGRGQMMTINSPTSSNQDMWQVTINVTAGNTYDLSAFVRSISSNNISDLYWYVGGSQIGSAVSAGVNTWNELATSFTATTSGNLVFSIRNNNTNNSGNDFALDNVIIYEHTPVTYLWTGPNGFTSTLANPTIPNAQPSNSGVYTLTVTKNGYSVSINKTITVDAIVITCLPPSVSLTRNNVNCNGVANGSINATGTLGNGGSGNITYQIWEGIAGTNVSDLTSNSNYPNSPNSSMTLGMTKAPTNFSDNYGSRMIGYIVPRESGTYYFWVSSDDASELWISTNSSPGNKILRASVPGWTNSEQWDKYPSQKSVGVTLTAGQIYYIEVLQKEGGGGDNLAVGWSKPGQPTTAPSEIIPPSALRPFVPSSLTTPVYQYSINGGAFQSSSSFTGLGPGNYTVTLQDTYGCTATSSISITEPAAFTSSASSNSPVCEGSTLSLTAGSVSGANYSWVGPDGFSSSNRTPSISNASNDESGIYSLTVNVGGCAITYTTNVTVTQDPVLSKTFINPSCGFNNGSITLNITDDPAQTQMEISINGGSTYPYTVNDDIGTFTINGLGTGSYAIRARWTTGSACSTSFGTTTLSSNNNLLGLTMSPDITTCKQTDVEISGATTLGVAPYSYSWNNAAGSTSTVTVSSATTKNYQLTVTDNAGCTATGNVTVSVVSSPGVAITSNDSLICVNGASTITSAIDISGTYNYQWQQSANGTSGWTNIFGATNSSFTNSFLSPGDYFYRVIVSGSSGACNPGTSNVFKITAVSTPTAAVVAPSNITCVNTQSSIFANVSNGTGSITYQWQQSANGTSGWYDLSGQTADSLNPAVNVSGNYYFRVIAYMSGIGCSYAVSPSYTFSVLNPGTVTISPSSSLICLNGNATLSASTSGVSGAYTYQWQKSNNNSTWMNISGATGNNYSPSNDSTGVRYYRINVNFSSCGFQSTSSVSIDVDSVHVVDASITNQPVCIGGTTQLLGTVTNGRGTITYQWQSRTSTFGTWNNISGATSINYTPPTSSAGTIYYRLRATSSASGCGAQYSPQIQMDIVPQTTVTIAPSSATICLNGNYNLTSSINNGVGPFTYQWQVSSTSPTSGFSNISGATNASYVIPTNALNTRYYRVIINAAGNGCIPATSSAQTITVLPLPNVSATNSSNTYLSTSQCINTIVRLLSSSTGTPTVTSYTWTNSSGFSSSQQNTTNLLVSGSSGGIYTVTGMGSNGCANTATTNVILNTNCGSICTSAVQTTPTNPSGCSNTDGKITIDEYGGNNYETSIDGINWFRGYHAYTGLGVGTYLIFYRDYTSKIICRTINSTLVSKTTAFYTSETVTSATSCKNFDGKIVISGVLPTDQVSWFAAYNPTYTTVSSLSPTNTISGLATGTYYVRVIRGGIYCFSEREVVVGNSGPACLSNAICSGSTSNLFVNGDFGSGAAMQGSVLPVGTTQYGYTNFTCYSPDDGFYSIVNNTDCNGASLGGNTFGTWDILTEDHTPGDTGGYMMVVNAAFNPDIVVEQAINNLCPNTQYNFTAWIRNIYPIGPIKPNFAFLIDGVRQYTTGNITVSGWNQVGFSFKTGNNTSAIFSIKNNAGGGNGNDWLIDDIVVNKCPLNITLNAQSVACLGGTNETISASIADPYGEYDYFKWEESMDNGVTWTQTTAPSQGTYISGVMNVSVNLPTPIVSALSGKLYRIRLATTLGSINDPTCSVTSQITQIIVPPVTVTITPPSTICEGQSVSLSASGAGGTAPYNYTWTPAAGLSATNIYNPTASPTTSTAYTVTATDVDNCMATATTSVTVIPMPIASATAQTVCSGASFSVMPTTNIVGTTYTWTSAVTSGTASGNGNQSTAIAGPITGTIINNTTGNAVVRYTVTPYNGTCPGATFTFDVTVRPNIVITNPGPETICSGLSFSRTPTSNIAGTQYTWTSALTSTPTGGTITGFTNNNIASSAPISQTLTNTGTTNGVVTYTVTPIANGCNGAPFSFAITVQPTIVITNPGPQTICSGAAFSSTPVSNIAGTTYKWTQVVTTAPTGGSISGNSNNSTPSAAPITQTLSNSGTTNGVVTYTITPVANGCDGTPFTFAITVQPTIIITNPGPQTICSGTAFSRTPTSNISGTTYSWTATITTTPTSGTITGFSDNLVASAAPISQTLTNSGTTNGVVTYTVTPVTAGCSGTPFTFAITIRPTLTASLSNPAVICSGASVAAVTPTSNIAGTTYTWTAPTMSAGVTGGVAQATGVATFSTGALSNSGAA